MGWFVNTARGGLKGICDGLDVCDVCTRVSHGLECLQGKSQKLSYMWFKSFSARLTLKNSRKIECSLPGLEMCARYRCNTMRAWFTVRTGSMDIYGRNHAW